MGQSKKNKTRTDAGLNVAGREAKATWENGILVCDAKYISSVTEELYANGVGLNSASRESQRATLLHALRFRGSRGLNTYEGTAAGYCRLATRVKELKNSDWDIVTMRETVVGPDGLVHKRIGRYIFLGRRSDMQDPQLNLELGD